MRLLPDKLSLYLPLFKLRRSAVGQVLVSTLLVLLIVSLTVVSLTITTHKNAAEVFNNLEYEKSYNYSESRILQAAQFLAVPKVDYANLGDNLGRIPGFDKCDTSIGTGAICGFTETPDSRRTVLKVAEVNYVEDYSLAKEEYFDVILFDPATNQQYNDTININWIGESALDISLIYEAKLYSNQELRTAEQVIDPSDFGLTKVYSSNGGGKGFLLDNPVTPAGGIKIDLSKLNTTLYPDLANAKLRYLRIKSVNNTIGSTITIRANATAKSSFPNQVRRLEAFDYSLANNTSSVPVVLTQLPLSPQVAGPLTFSLNSNSVRSPICGNGLVEGGEYCDDGNNKDGDACPKDCSCKDDFDTALFKTTNNMGDGILCGGRDFGRADMTTQTSEVMKVCASSDLNLIWSPGSLLDDLLVMILPDENITTRSDPNSSGSIFTLPSTYLIIIPNAGVLDGNTKTFKVTGNPNLTYSFSTQSTGNGAGFKAAGFNTVGFEDGISVQTLQKLGFIDKGLATFKFVHIAAGCGLADVELGKPDSKFTLIDKPPKVGP